MLNPRVFLDYCQAQLPAMMTCLKRAVEIESPTSSKLQVDRMATFFAREFARASATVKEMKHPMVGAGVIAEFFSRAKARSGGSKPILLLGHTDTVWDVGTIKRIPFRISKGRAYGPGILDMKSGTVIGLWAIRALQAASIVPSGPVRFFLNSDEEVSSRAFRKEILTEARKARAVFVLEPAADRGALKTARKGVGEFQITVHGRSAHAGINPAAGVNAIAELARQLLRIEEFAHPNRGLTLNAGTIQGGTRSNVIPEFATARIDVRIPRLSDQKVIERQVYSLKAVNPEARVEIQGGINRPPMEHAMAAALFAKARELGRQMGMTIEEASTGGGSDGNFTAALGVPTLDGLGGVGDGAHALHEHIIIAELPRRAALLAALIASI